MGSAWCKNRAAAADDSKSTVGRVFVRCVNQMCPAQTADPAGSPRQIAPATRNEGDKEATFQLWVTPHATVGPPLPERPPPHSAVSSTAWQSAVLTVPDPEPPVPPPRTKRRRRRLHSAGRPLGRSLSLRTVTPEPHLPPLLRRAGSACELTPAADPPRFVFDFTSYGSSRTPPPSPAREDATAAVDILRDLGLPASLRGGGEGDKLGRSRASSGRSSMTPSLSELEAALSDLLEAGAAARDDDEEAEPPVKPPHTRYHRAPPLPKEVLA